jgi:ribosomal protein S18 acetylase RimI-like enzyme
MHLGRHARLYFPLRTVSVPPSVRNLVQVRTRNTTDSVFPSQHTWVDGWTRVQHWYVMHVSTLPNYQGKGYGKKLMQFINKLADADRVPIFIEVRSWP